MKYFSLKQFSSFMFGIIVLMGSDLYSQTTTSSGVGARLPTTNPNVKGNELEQKLQKLLEVHGLLLNQAIVGAERNASSDVIETNKKELQANASQIANVFVFYFNQKVSDQFKNLFDQHIALGGKYIEAVKDKNQSLASEVSNQAFVNGRMIAQFFSELLPTIPLKTWQKVWDEHVTMEAEQTNLYFQRDFGKAATVRNRSIIQLKEIGSLIANGIQKK